VLTSLSPNLIVQALTLASGLLVNFLFPALFGLTEYGRFLQGLLATFVLQRLIEVGAEPLIALVDGNRIFATALATNGLAAVLLAAACAALQVRGVDPVLLGAMVLTSTVLLTLHRNRMQAALIAYLLVFLVAFVGLTAWRWIAPESLSLRDVLLWTNAGSALLGLALLARARRIDADPRALGDGLRSGFALMPRAVASSLVSNVLTTAFLLVASYALTARELGTLRVGTSIVQAATSLFPANMKAIFVAMADAGAAQRVRGLLGASFWLFLGVACIVVLGVAAMPGPVAGAGLAFVAIPYFWAMCLERYVLMSGGRAATLRRVNVVVAAVMLAAAFTVDTLDEALRFYAVAVAAWCVVLAVLARPAAPPATVTVVAAVSVAGLVLAQQSFVLAPAAAALLAAVGWVGLRPDRRTVEMLQGRL
jgi:hypothetical protein